MRQRWLRSLALALGVLALGRCPFLGADTPAPIIEPYPPVDAPQRSQAELGNENSRLKSADPAPTASLDRPIALRDEGPDGDRKIQPTGLFSPVGNNAFALSPAGSSFPVAQPLPAGPGSASAPMPMPTPVSRTPPPDVPYSWRQPTTSYPTSQDTLTAPTLVPMPSSPRGSSFGMDSSVPPGTSYSMDSAMPPGTIVSTPGTIVSPGVVPTPGAVVTPGAVPGPGVVTGPMGAPLVDGGCMGHDCCSPGCCCPPSSCAPDCCAPDCCAQGCCPSCCDGCCGCWNNGGCCFGNRWYGSAEYLLWFIRGQNVPPLLTTGPLFASTPGAIGQLGTTVLYGNNIQANNPYSGMRLRGGYWFGDGHGLGLDLGGFFLGGNNTNFSSSSMGVPFLGRPFTNALTGLQDVEAVAAPGLAGTFNAVNTFFLYGVEANLRRNFLCGCNWFIDGFAGWRLLGLNESLSMTEKLAVVSSVNPMVPAGSTFLVNDRFGTSNLFNGAQIGVIGEYRLGRWSFDLRTSAALGGTQQFVNISGATTTAGPGILPTTSPGGLLALSSNIGPHTRGMVSMVDEVGFNVGYQFTNHIRGFVGYNFLWWSSVVRPAEQIDLNVNPNLIPPVVGGGANRPQFSFNGSNFWVQGIQFGIDIRW
jgi:hypothetical protein